MANVKNLKPFDKTQSQEETKKMCGDSIDEECIKMLMGGYLAEIVFTDKQNPGQRYAEPGFLFYEHRLKG